jgi:hypothetical protein
VPGVPLPSRDLAAGVARTGRASGDLHARALEVLLDPALSHVVDLVCWRVGERVHVADADGHVALSRDGSHDLLSGRDPVADQDPFSDSTCAHPLAAVRLHSLFADERAPDLAVVHTGGHGGDRSGESWTAGVADFRRLRIFLRTGSAVLRRARQRQALAATASSTSRMTRCGTSATPLCPASGSTTYRASGTRVANHRAWLSDRRSCVPCAMRTGQRTVE